MAVALAELKTDKRQFVSRQKVKLQRFFGKCEMPDGSVKFLVAKVADISEVNTKLHTGYRIACVLDILTETDMERRQWCMLRPSLLQRAEFM